MEALADASFDALFELKGGYDAENQTFSNEGRNTRDLGSSVRYVSEKKIPASHPPNTVGGGLQIKSQADQNRSEALYDKFSGIIDGISGELLHGTREYILTGEVYEGAFAYGGQRHGNNAIVKNAFIYNCLQPSSLQPYGASFYGTYFEDAPLKGTLVIPNLYTYHGSFRNFRPHGPGGTLVKQSGYKFEGAFKNGLPCGEGIEKEQSTSGGAIYEGSFKEGKRNGFGIYSIGYEGDEVSKKALYRFLGNWSYNVRQGEGEEYIASTEVYRGQFHANERHGYGSLTFLDVSSKDKAEENQSKNLLSAEGIWRAGTPLDGTSGWVLMYNNGDVYSGHASHFSPSGYGVMRYKNKDVYTGNWENGMRHGEGFFLASNGTEEYYGNWLNDKIKPIDDGFDDNMRIRLIESTKTLLNSEEVVSIGEINSMIGKVWSDNVNPFHKIPEDGINSDTEYIRQSELFQKVVNKSVVSSIQLLEENISDWHKAKSYPPDWPETTEILMQERMRTSFLVREDDIDSDTTDSISGEQGDNETEIMSESKEIPKTNLITYPNGDTYLGTIDSERETKEDYGVYLSAANGSSYSGQFKGDRRNGYGILVHPLGKYCGDFVNDVKESLPGRTGTLILNDASSYHGQFQGGIFHGNGTLCEKDGTVYVGEWKYGKRSGDGYETLADGKVYVGEYKDDKREGVGTLLERARGRVIYSGLWSDGVYHGEGVLVERHSIQAADLAAGSPIIGKQNQKDSRNLTIQYQGNFFHGQRHGHGTLRSNNFISHEGTWHLDSPIDGKWNIKYQDGAIYTGSANINTAGPNMEGGRTKTSMLKLVTCNLMPQPNGSGTMKYRDGDEYIGDFSFGARQGFGKYNSASGDVEEGEWKDNELVIQP